MNSAYARIRGRQQSEKTLLDQNPVLTDHPQDKQNRRAWLISLTSLLFVLLQSACTAFMALSGLRLVVGVSSLAAAAVGAKFLDSVHGEAIRIPMELLAVAGSIFNLIAIWRVRSLRTRPSSQWRVTPITAKKKRAESVQILLAILTLLLVAVEWAFHLYIHHSI